jgi:hypothetical protein
MLQFKLVMHGYEFIAAEDEDDALVKFYEDLARNNETAETYLASIIKVERV